MSESYVGAVEAISLLDEPVRRDIYEWVVRQAEPVSRDATAGALGISRALAALHLDRLANAGLLETEFRRLTGRTGPGAGRPAKLYRRASREVAVSLPDRRYELAAEVFACALERGAPDEEGVGTAAHDAGMEIGRSGRRGRASTKRVLRVLDGAGYQPVVDPSGAIRLRNCPFHALAQEHRELTCGMNLSMMRGILDGLGEGGLSAGLDPQPGWCCVVLHPDTKADDIKKSDEGTAAN